MILDVLELQHAHTPFTVVDLACGPGSLSARILEKFEHASVVGIDYDPMLLELARQSSTRFGDRLQLIDADLAGADWPNSVAAPVQAIVSTTALHWLQPQQLVEVYRQCRELLSPAGVLLNGDHFRFDGRSPAIGRWANAHDEQTQRSAFAAGAPEWDSWWDELRATHGIGALTDERERRFAGRDATAPQPSTSSWRARASRFSGVGDGLATVRRLRGLRREMTTRVRLRDNPTTSPCCG